MTKTFKLYFLSLPSPSLSRTPSLSKMTLPAKTPPPQNLNARERNPPRDPQLFPTNRRNFRRNSVGISVGISDWNQSVGNSVENFETPSVSAAVSVGRSDISRRPKFSSLFPSVMHGVFVVVPPHSNTFLHSKHTTVGQVRQMEKYIWQGNTYISKCITMTKYAHYM